MSFFSWSAKKKSYKYGKHGNKHYKRRGLLGKLLFSSSRRSHASYHYETERPSYVPVTERPNLKQVTCTSCEAQIPAGSKFCLQCGTKVETAQFCSNCGQKLPAGAKFCSNCGTQTDA